MRVVVTALACFLALVWLTAPLLAEKDPAKSPSRHRLAAQKTLAWLLAQDDLLNVDASNGFAAGKALCAVAMTGFLLEQFPELDGFDRHRARIHKQLAGRIRTGAATQGTWSDGLFGLYLAERHQRGKKDTALFATLVRRIEDGQNADGGWGHGGFSISFYPSTLIAATNLSVLSLGLGQRLKQQTDGDVFKKARRLYRDVQSAAGAWPYGGRPYRKGFEAGRTAGAVAALRALDNPNDAGLIARARRYLLANADRVPHGHASPALHVFSGALAFAALGRSPRFYATLNDVCEHQRDDGTFRDIIANSPDSLAILGRTKQDRAYLSALYAAALVVHDSQVAKLLRKGGAATDPIPDAGSTAAVRPVWTLAQHGVVGLVPRKNELLIATRDGTLRRMAAETGTPVGKDVQIELAPGHAGRAAWMAGDHLLFVASKTRAQQRPVRIVNGVPSAPPPSLVLVAVDPVTGRTAWTARVRSLANGATQAGDELILTSRVQPPRRLRLKDGTDLGPLPAPNGIVNRDLAIASDGRIAVTGESELWMLSPTREMLWRKKTRARRRLLAPAKGALAWLGKRLLEGTTSGQVRCRDSATGRSIWKYQHRAAIDRIATTAKRILVLGADGTLLCLDAAGALVWQQDAPLGREIGLPRGALELSASHAAVVGPHGGLRVYNLKTGRLRARLAFHPDDGFALAGRRLYVAHGGNIAAYELGKDR